MQGIRKNAVPFLLFFSCVVYAGTAAESSTGNVSDSVKNVLVIDGVFSPSHQIWMRALCLALGAENYNVTVLSLSKQGHQMPPNVHYLEMPELAKWNEEVLSEEVMSFGQMSTFMKVWFFIQSYDEQDKIVATSQGFKQLLGYPRDFKFDLMIFDHLSPFMTVGLKEYFNNPPLITVSPFPGVPWTNMMTGGPEFPSFMAHIMKDSFEDSFVERIENFLVTTIYNLLQKFYLFPKCTENFRKWAPDSKETITELLHSSRIQLPNYAPVIDPIQPLMPSVIPVGGLQIAKPKPLPQDLEEIFAKATKGIILFALGSNAKSEDLGQEKLQMVMNVLGEFPEYNIIWKIDITGMDLVVPENVHPRKWLPQNDILADKRTVLFISHAGGLSTHECVWYGLPMLALPVWFDQYPNSKRVVNAGIGKRLNIYELQKEEFMETLFELLSDKKYTENAQLLSRRFRDQPESPMERALWWIDYVLRNPEESNFLQDKKLQERNYFTKHSMDVVGFLTICLVFIVGVSFKILCCLCRKRDNPEKTNKKTQ